MGYVDAETMLEFRDKLLEKINQGSIRYPSWTGIAAVTTSPYYCAQWNGVDEGITELYDGLTIIVRVPVAGNGTYGTGIRINDGELHPAVYNINSMIGTRYSVNSTVIFTYNSTQTGNLYLNGTSATSVTGVWQMADYDVNSTTTYGTIEYYFKPYVADKPLTRYKLVALDKDNRIIPITTDQYIGTWASSTTYSIDTVVYRSSKYYKSLQNTNKNHKPESNPTWWELLSAFTPNDVAFKPGKIWFYNTTTTIAAGSVIGGQTLTAIGYNANVVPYTFATTITTYKLIYLCGNYNRNTGLFTLDNSADNSYFTTIPGNIGNLILSDYFTSGKDYILVGAIYSSNNYLQLFMVNDLFHFDGNNLIPYETWVSNASLTPELIGSSLIVSNIVDQFKGVSFNVNLNDYNGYYFFTYGNCMMSVPIYNLTEGTEYKVAGAMVDINGQYGVKLLTYKYQSGVLYFYQKENYMPLGYTAYLFKIKLY